MYKKIVCGVLVIVGLALAWTVLDGGQNGTKNVVFHVSLADPDLYKNGIYSEEITLDGGQYVFRFVPNGDSPRILGISISGEVVNFSEDFELVGTLHETAISEYYTWNYSGQRSITVLGQGDVRIEIDPRGNVMGAVTVDILKDMA